MWYNIKTTESYVIVILESFTQCCELIYFFILLNVYKVNKDKIVWKIYIYCVIRICQLIFFSYSNTRIFASLFLSYYCLTFANSLDLLDNWMMELIPMSL